MASHSVQHGFSALVWQTTHSWTATSRTTDRLSPMCQHRWHTITVNIYSGKCLCDRTHSLFLQRSMSTGTRTCWLTRAGTASWVNFNTDQFHSYSDLQLLRMWERPTDNGIAAFLAETNMLPPCRHGGPETLQCVGCLARRHGGNIPHVESTNLF